MRAISVPSPPSSTLGFENEDCILGIKYKRRSQMEVIVQASIIAADQKLRHITVYDKRIIKEQLKPRTCTNQNIAL